MGWDALAHAAGWMCFTTAFLCSHSAQHWRDGRILPFSDRTSVFLFSDPSHRFPEWHIRQNCKKHEFVERGNGFRRHVHQPCPRCLEQGHPSYALVVLADAGGGCCLPRVCCPVVESCLLLPIRMILSLGTRALDLCFHPRTDERFFRIVSIQTWRLVWCLDAHPLSAPYLCGLGGSVSWRHASLPVCCLC
eukprot:scaffold867_cov317-Pavlova_lutheri.AAC.66